MPEYQKTEDASEYFTTAGLREENIARQHKTMNKFKLVAVLLCLTVVLGLTGCKEKPIVSGSYDFVIYESDGDNNDLSDNKEVARYHIEFTEQKTVTDTLIKKGSKYYFSEDSADYLVMQDGGFGLTYTNGYFENYSECAGEKEIDISWSYTAVNGTAASAAMGETSLEGLTEFGFVINGWK